MPQVPTVQTMHLRICPLLALLRVMSLHQLRLLHGSSSHLGSGNTSSTFAPLAPEGDSSFPLLMVSGWPQCLPGALSAFLLPLVPAQNSWHGICLPVWTLLRHWPSFCYLNGCATFSFICPLQRSKCPYTSHQDIPPFLSLASPELLQIPGDGFISKSGKALELEPKVTWSQRASTFLKKPRGTSTCMKGHCSFLSNHIALHGWTAAFSRDFLCGRFSLLLDNSDICCKCLIEPEITLASCLPFSRVALGSVCCLSSTVILFLLS